MPDEMYTIPFGEAAFVREGDDVTVVAFGQMVGRAAAAIDALESEGISCDLIDPRTSSPLDEGAILESLEATGRLVVVDESPPRCGLTADIAGMAATKAFQLTEGPGAAGVCATQPDTIFTGTGSGIHSQRGENQRGDQTDSRLRQAINGDKS